MSPSAALLLVALGAALAEVGAFTRQTRFCALRGACALYFASPSCHRHSGTRQSTKACFKNLAWLARLFAWIVSRPSCTLNAAHVASAENCE